MGARALLEELFDVGIEVDPSPAVSSTRTEDLLSDLFAETREDTDLKATAQREIDVVSELEARLSDRTWRLNNLYHVVNKKGQVVRFQMNDAQVKLFDRLHDRNIVLKSRQVGMTTGVMVYMLDAVMFQPNTSCGVIAHGLREVSDLFRKKILFAYDLLPEWLRTLRPAKKRTAGELVISHPGGDSSITVGVSLRSGTYQYVHVSEFGKICRLYPQRAEEVITGTLQTLHEGSTLVIESTAEGRQGHFFDYAMAALGKARAGQKLTRLDNRLHFFPWYDDPDCVLSASEAEHVLVNERLQKYFDTLEDVHGAELNLFQKCWYVKKEEELGAKIKQEYPSTVDEAFEKTIEGAYYAQQLMAARQQGRILPVRYNPAFPLHAVWDIGYNDCTAIWFVQVLPTQTNVLRYYENNGEGLAHYSAKLREFQGKLGYRYAGFVAGHDIAHHDWSTGKTRKDVAAENYAIKFDAAPKLGVNDGIELSRMLLNECYFDESGCEQGLARLESYTKKWNATLGCYHDTPLHDINSNGADAFRYIAQWHARYGSKRLQLKNVNPAVAPGTTTRASVSRVR